MSVSGVAASRGSAAVAEGRRWSTQKRASRRGRHPGPWRLWQGKSPHDECVEQAGRQAFCWGGLTGF